MQAAGTEAGREAQAGPGWTPPVPLLPSEAGGDQSARLSPEGLASPTPPLQNPDTPDPHGQRRRKASVLPGSLRYLAHPQGL